VLGFNVVTVFRAGGGGHITGHWKERGKGVRRWNFYQGGGILGVQKQGPETGSVVGRNGL